MNVASRLLVRPAIRTYNNVQEVIEGSIAYVGEVSVLFWRVLRNLWRGSDYLEQMARIGVHSMPIALITVLLSGAVFALYIAKEMVSRGAGSFVGGVVAIVMVKELAPVLVAIVVAARAGSAMAAEIGSMKVTEQLDALRTMATSPEQYLVVSRFVAAVTMLPIVSLIAMFTGIIGGYAVSRVEGVSRTTYFASIPDFVSFVDVQDSMVKALVFGAIIALVSCHQGLNAEGGATGVGNATTRSVVLCVVLVYVADFIIVRLQTHGMG